jgi:hypothetical protein
MLCDPMTGKGFVSWALLGLGASLIALTVSIVFPSIIPTSATTVKL